MAKRNPKQEGSNVFDCKPQSGPCPVDCNQCFYNRPDAFYVDINKPHMPTPEEVGDGIVRVNCGHDSNIEREKVIKETEQYPRKFFNTSMPYLDFPAPVVFTANAEEEKPAKRPGQMKVDFKNSMFVRLRVSGTNLQHIQNAASAWTDWEIPVVLTFMAYYDKEPPWDENNPMCRDEAYIWKTRHVNSYWCATKAFMVYVLNKMRPISRLVSLCGGLESNYCRECRNCETYYWQTIKRMRGE